ncbi:MAG: hypothetical protein C3F15_02260 [Holophagae bacterium]|nr:MAG: hypothetical protein C3F15_02260 [Holophagae bacterium]
MLASPIGEGHRHGNHQESGHSRDRTRAGGARPRRARAARGQAGRDAVRRRADYAGWPRRLDGRRPRGARGAQP